MVNALKHGTNAKRVMYIEKNMEINQEFPWAHPNVKCKLNRIYNSSFSGSVLYDIFSKPVRQLENSWSVSVRQMWGLPLNTHKYFVEPLGGVHAHSMIISRFVNFLQSALKFKKLPVQFMLRRSLVNFNSITEKKMQATSNS